VYIRRRIGRRRSFFRKNRILLSVLACGCACLFAVIYIRGFLNPVAIEPVKAPVQMQVPARPAGFEIERHGRVVYPYSVIAGGVRSREGLVASMARDPVVAAHFADFKVSRARMTRAEKTQFAHVSYRMGDNVFWTAKLLKIPEGETLVTDGSEVARARCGNRVSAAPKEPVSEEEPLIETFEIPTIETPEIGGLAFHEPAPVPEPNLAMREFSPLDPIVTQPKILPYYFRPLFVIRPPDYYIPEPGTLSLLLAGLAAFFAVKLIRKR
jgi:hypothetical protein